MNLIHKFSVWFVVAVPVVAGLSILDFEIAGFNYTGFIWAAMLSLGLYLLALNRLSGVSPSGIAPIWPWLVWSGFVWASLLWCEEITRRNLQDALQLCMPIVVGLLAAVSIRTHAQLRWLCTSFGVAMALLAMFAAAYVAGTFDREWMSTNMRGAAMTAVLAGGVFLATFPRRKLLPIAGWGLALLITALTSSRMASLALLVMPIILPYSKRMLIWKGLAVAACVALGLFLFNSQTFQEHFFQSGKGTLQDLLAGDFNDLGRFEAWAAIWDEAWRRPWLGYGVGTAYDFVPQVWDEMNHVHNDYLRIFYELGVVGLTIYLFVVAWQLIRLHQTIAATDGIARSTLSAAWLGFFALLISSFTDNTLIYAVLYTNPLFALWGAGYGVAWAEKRENSKVASDAIATAHNKLVSPPLPKLRVAATAPLANGFGKTASRQMR